MGSIEDLWQRADGTPKGRYGQGKRYKAIPWLAGFDGGAGRRGPTQTFDHYRDAEFYNARIERGDDETAVAEGARATRARRQRSFAEYVTEVSNVLGDEKATRNNYASMGRALARQWPTEGLDEIMPDMIDTYFSDLLKQGYSSSARAKRATVLRTTYRRALRNGYVKVDPTTDIQPIKQITQKPPRPVTEEEFTWILSETPAWMRPAMHLTYYTGLRSGEICGLRWGAIDFDGAQVEVRTGMQADGTLKLLPKNNRPGRVPLMPETVELLRDYRERFPGKDTDLVVREPEIGGRRPLMTRRWRLLFKRACHMASVPVPLPHPHDMRHGCAARLKKRGAPPHMVQAVLRHQNIASTMIYFPRVEVDEMREFMGGTSREIDEQIAPPPVGEDEPEQSA